MKKEFTWNEKKNRKNQRKHGVSFEEAIEVFYDPKNLEMYDWTHSFFEDRWKMIGFSGTAILTVFFSERNKVIKIFSARKSAKIEEEEYLNGFGTFYTR